MSCKLANKSIFGYNARNYTLNIDGLLARGDYQRGNVFAELVEREVQKGSRVLDYGCGPGRMTRMLAERGYFVDGVDPTPNMIAEAVVQQYDPTWLSFRLNDGTGNDLPSQYYDGIVCSSVIEFIANAEYLLANFARTLKPCGTLILTYSNFWSLWRVYVRMRYHSSLPHHTLQRNIWTGSQVRSLLARNGFSLTFGPIFREAAPFDKRPALRFLTALPIVGMLGLVVARRAGNETGDTTTPEPNDIDRSINIGASRRFAHRQSFAARPRCLGA